MKSSKILSTLGGLFGTIVPAAVLIVLGVAYLCMGKPIMLTHESFFPDFTKIGTVVLAASIFLFYGGMEMNAVHVRNMKNPPLSPSVLSSRPRTSICWLRCWWLTTTCGLRWARPGSAT